MNSFSVKEKVALSKIRKILFEDIDPIRQEYIRKRFLLHRNKVAIMFDATVLFEYIQTSGDLCDPIAREEYKLHELMRLERICGKRLLEKPRLDEIRIHERERQELISYFTDEVIRSSQGNVVAIEALENIHSIATRQELVGIYSTFRRNGVDVLLENRADNGEGGGGEGGEENEEDRERRFDIFNNLSRATVSMIENVWRRSDRQRL
jgi:hypothetical protein